MLHSAASCTPAALIQPELSQHSSYIEHLSLLQSTPSLVIPLKPPTPVSLSSTFFSRSVWYLYLVSMFSFSKNISANVVAACKLLYLPGLHIPHGSPGTEYSTYDLVRQLNGSQDHVTVLEKFSNRLSKVKNAANVMLGLFAGIGAALIAVPAVEESHWSTTAFFLSAILLSIGGVIIGALLPRFFHLFFGRDLDVLNPQTTNRLTWHEHRVLLLVSCMFFAYQSAAIALSSVFLVAGIFALTITADFSAGAAPTNHDQHRLQFVVTVLGPFIAYMVIFWMFSAGLCVAHRRARGSLA